MMQNFKSKYLDISLDAVVAVRTDRVWGRALNQLQIAHRVKFHRQILKRVARLVHNQNIWDGI